MATGTENKVDPQLFARTADTTGAIAKDAARLCQDWNKAMGTLRGVWQGDTSDDIKNTVAQVQKSADALLQALAGYQATLRELAGIYDKTEKNVQESGKSLKFDRAFR